MPDTFYQDVHGDNSHIFFSNFWHFPEVCLLFGWHGDKSSCMHSLLNSRFYSTRNEIVQIRYLNCRYPFLSCAKSSTRCQPLPACLCTCSWHLRAVAFQVSQQFKKVWKTKDGKRSADMERGCDREAEMFIIRPLNFFNFHIHSARRRREAVLTQRGMWVAWSWFGLFEQAGMGKPTPSAAAVMGSRLER